jgi:hypothetical protein
LSGTSRTSAKKCEPRKVESRGRVAYKSRLGADLPVKQVSAARSCCSSAWGTLRQVDRQFGFHPGSGSSMIARCELWRRSSSRHTELSGNPSAVASFDFDQPRAHRLVDGELGNDQRRQGDAVARGWRDRASRQWPAGLHVALSAATKQSSALRRGSPMVLVLLAPMSPAARCLVVTDGSPSASSRSAQLRAPTRSRADDTIVGLLLFNGMDAVAERLRRPLSCSKDWRRIAARRRRPSPARDRYPCESYHPS